MILSVLAAPRKSELLLRTPIACVEARRERLMSIQLCLGDVPELRIVFTTTEQVFFGDPRTTACVAVARGGEQSHCSGHWHPEATVPKTVLYNKLGGAII